MKKYRVTVNGTAYEIELEELTGAAPAPAAAAPAPAPAAAPAGGEQVTSPMPGTILDVKVSQGASVKKGDVLMILEAMKMENEIMCPCDGKVASINAAKGAAVESGTLLCVIQ
ncbi:biotin/lipoyl-containing protein [Oscillibacter sp.]|uniref:biotin/lipoyl-containing protein n=1 Tax=Oscillibacter sp. TaxID=1945593 RepID=UPI002171BE08|nr:biotin/lipoyl-containing protein [Oscillibacter sp.]MCI9113168.1 biotin/lipoyl-binding protein [Oscillibacter sp.]